MLREHVLQRLGEIDAALKRHGAAPPDDALIVSRPVLARLLGVHQDTVTRFTGHGMPVHKPGHRNVPGEYDAIVCSAWWRAREVGGLDAEKSRRERSQAELNELKLARQRGEVISARDVEIRWTARVLAVRTKFLGVMTKARQLLPHLTAKDLLEFDGLIREALEELASDR